MNIKIMRCNSLIVLIPLTMVVLMSSCAKKSQTVPRGEQQMPADIVKEIPKEENTIAIILEVDSSGNFKPKGYTNIDQEQAQDIWMDDSGKDKIMYKIYKKVTGGYEELKHNKYQLDVNFNSPDDGDTNNACPKISKWPRNAKNSLKANSHFIIVNKKDHKNHACYNYDLTVVTKEDGVDPIKIDPWLRVRHR